MSILFVCLLIEINHYSDQLVFHIFLLCSQGSEFLYVYGFSQIVSFFFCFFFKYHLLCNSVNSIIKFLMLSPLLFGDIYISMGYLEAVMNFLVFYSRF